MAPITRSLAKQTSSEPLAEQAASDNAAKRQAPQETPAVKPSPKEVPAAPSEKNLPCPFAKQHRCDEVFATRVKASCHAILKHNMAPIHLTEDRRLICPHADPPCSKTFETRESLNEHLKSKHRGKKFPCPLSECLGCTYTCVSLGGMAAHVSAVHRQIRWPCLVAEETGCEETFTCHSAAWDHANRDHGGAKHPCPLAKEYNCAEMFFVQDKADTHANRQHRGLKYLCPLSKKFGCKERFGNSVRADKHAKEAHGQAGFPCPDAEQYQCGLHFPTRGQASRHSLQDHKEVRYACPRAKELGCSATYTDKSSAQRHALSAHNHVRFPCPDAQKEGCEETFANQSAANQHANSAHRNIRYPCPVSDKYDCREVFTTKYWATKHAEMHSHPFRCQHFHCKERFETVEEAVKHSYDDKHPLATVFLCPVLGCLGAEAGYHLPKDGIPKHRMAHVRAGDIEEDDEFKVEEVEGSLPWSDLPLFIDILNHHSLDLTNPIEVDGGGSPETGGSDDDGSPETNGIDDEDHDAEVLALGEDEADLNGPGIKTLSTEHKSRIYRTNKGKWVGANYCPVGVRNLKRMCRGPSLLKYRLKVDEPCPYNSTIDFDTARLMFSPSGRRHSPRLSLEGRCVACHSEHSTRTEIRKWLVKESLVGRAGQSMCEYRRCTKPTVHGSKGCEQHILKLKNTVGRKFDPRPVQEVFKSAAQEKWTCPPAYNVVLQLKQKIFAGAQPGSRLVFLDNEFSIASGELWETSIIEVVSGDVLINTTIKHDQKLNHNGIDFLSRMSYAQAKHIYSSSRSGIERMNVHLVAARLKEVGICRETIILVWHTNTADLKILRNFLDSSGYSDIMPPDENCIPLINIIRSGSARVRKNLFPMRLEHLFPVMYPGHEYVGLNHAALIDCKQTRLVCEGFEQLCKPVEEREGKWRPENIAKPSQRSVLDWAKKADDVQNESLKRKDAPAEDNDAGARRARIS